MRSKLFFTAFLQVFLVCVSTYCIAHDLVVFAVMSSFGISFVWTGNVKKVVFGSTEDRLIYAGGAAAGTAAGLAITFLYTKI